MKTYKIASMGGDGIGPEVIHAGVEVLQALGKAEGYALQVKEFDWSSERFLKHGAYIPEGSRS